MWFFNLHRKHIPVNCGARAQQIALSHDNLLPPWHRPFRPPARGPLSPISIRLYLRCPAREARRPR
jgi:hypothetical protein